ncbi:MAG: sugar phosphate nucleotidyltransferase [Patescibacteria group bacterium]|nr:sugar phosphate nucleotidyltransferase [Patescibacteria group bacterium]
MNRIGAVILAAGKGSRMKLRVAKNKVILPLGDKPMVLHTVELLVKSKLKPIIVVVGFAQKSVMNILRFTDVVFVYQRKRLGTAHALSCAFRKIPESMTDLVVLQGDDSAFYTKAIIKELIKKHVKSRSSITLLTINVKNPYGLGRIIRNKKGEITEIVEEKDANQDQKKIKEINPACYIFKADFLKKYLKKVKKSKLTGEYYLTSLIGLALKNHKKVDTFSAGNIPWRGVNTPDELKEAEKMFLQA